MTSREKTSILLQSILDLDHHSSDDQTLSFLFQHKWQNQNRDTMVLLAIQRSILPLVTRAVAGRSFSSVPSLVIPVELVSDTL
jgi:hypothetical protein